MKNKSTIILISILFALLNVGCLNDCKNYKPKDNYNAISQGDLNLVPYTGYDTIIFLRNNIDTISFYGTGKKKIFTLENGNLGGCGPASIEHKENYQYNYISNLTQEKILIEIRFPDYFDFYFKGKRFNTTASDLWKPFDLFTININGIVFNDISFIPKLPKDTIFYNIQDGILKIAFQNGEQWTLIKNK